MPLPPPVRADAPPRIALYSHDTMGLGHVRRNMLLAQALSAAPLQAEVLLISGIREAGAFALPPGTDCVTLPAYRKLPDGRYMPRALGADLQRLVALRAATIRAALAGFAPDLVIVDNVPRGAMRELDTVLPALDRRRTRVVLGLRDVVDEPAAVQRQWRHERNVEALRQYYDAIWVYGDESLSGGTAAYGLDAALRRKLVQVGYLDQSQRLECGAARAPDGPYVLCLVGGGQDGLPLTETFVQARLPDGHRGIVVAGAMMPAAGRARLHRLAAARPGMQVLDFVAEPLALMRGARAIVAMGGYNTTTEILSLEQRALIVPRVRPREEQWLRARRLAELGLVDCLHPDALSAARLSAWLCAEGRPRRAREVLDFGGLQRVRTLAQELLHGLRKERCLAAA
ncbi:glycosyltransferase family protein [Pseudorhodoferax sp.]|uniref:glycosyltransferase family protein n=1 Tax=Pseudorhodoferax sp. TaxID=1993553 RepID=UPI0039E26D8E